MPNDDNMMNSDDRRSSTQSRQHASAETQHSLDLADAEVRLARWLQLRRGGFVLVMVIGNFCYYPFFGMSRRSVALAIILGLAAQFTAVWLGYQCFRRWVGIDKLARRLAASGDPIALPTVIAALSLRVRPRRPLEEALQRLLPNVTPENASVLQDEHRDVLRAVTARRTPPHDDVLLAILGYMHRCGDPADLQAVTALVRKGGCSVAVHSAALEAQAALTVRVGQDPSERLLRPTSRPADEAETLLRPVAAAASEDDTTRLVRPAD